MTFLVTSDIHLTDSPADEYRWGLFPWLKEQVKKHKVGTILILGDLTDRKENHSSFLTNRICDTLVDLALHSKVILLKGNHDFIDERTPFFRFINQLNNPNLQFVIEPSQIGIDGKKCLFLPCTRKNHSEEWDGIDFTKYDYIFCHETFSGAISETGMPLDGISRTIFGDTPATIISGDVHLPQDLGIIRYCGAPFRQRFGDRYNGRCLLINNAGKQTELHFPCMKKHTVELFDSADDSWLKDVAEGDQVKFRMNLKRSEIHDWDSHKQKLLQLAKSHKVSIHGIELIVIDKQKQKASKKAVLNDPKEYFELYCKREKIGELERSIGDEILNS